MLTDGEVKVLGGIMSVGNTTTAFWFRRVVGTF